MVSYVMVRLSNRARLASGAFYEVGSDQAFLRLSQERKI
jgi:hypothetical protein